MFYQTACRNECRTTILEAYKPAWLMLTEYKITTDGYRASATGCKDDLRYIKTGRPSYARGRRRAQTYLHLYGKNDSFMRSLWDRYEVVYGWPSPTAMIQREDATIHAEKSTPLHPCRLSANDYRSSFQCSNNDYWRSGPAELFPRNWELECKRTWKYGEYDRLLGCLQVRYTYRCNSR